MANKRARQVDGGRKEAPFSTEVEGELSLAQQKDQTLLATDQESDLDLLQEFTQYLQRWKDVLLTSEYETFYKEKARRGRRIAQVDIIQDEGHSQKVFLSGHNQHDGGVRVIGQSDFEISNIGRREKPKTKRYDTFMVILSSLDENRPPIYDPQTNEQLSKIIITEKREQIEPSPRPGKYSLTLVLGTTKEDPSPLYRRNNVTHYKLYKQNVKIIRGYPLHPPLSNEHARAVFQLVDSFIPAQERPETLPATPQRRTPGNP